MTETAPEKTEQEEETPPVRPNISISRGFGEWLQVNRLSLAATTYQTGQLFLMGVNPDGRVNVDWSNFTHATGLAWDGGLWVGSLFQIWRLEPSSRPLVEPFDLTLIPRKAHTIGRLDVHDFHADRSDRLIFANTRYSCLATLDPEHSFKPIWKPPFISELVAEDRCHLNGFTMRNGTPAYVTAVSRTDHLGGWREQREGVILDVPRGEVVADGFRMPHSPRLHDGRLFALDSGRGRLVEVDLKTGALQEIAFCPGFLRGLAIHNNYAIIGSSKPRHKLFGGLPLQDELDKRKEEPWCGIFVVDLRTGAIAEWLRFNTVIVEMFDVVALPNVRCPHTISIESKEIVDLVTFGGFGPLDPAAAKIADKRGRARKNAR
jgi:uncharacterized protein (TIGR03032 family)